MHSAMWNSDEFFQQIIDEVMGLARSIDKVSLKSIMKAMKGKQV